MPPWRCRLLIVSVLFVLHALLARQPGNLAAFGVAKLVPCFHDAFAPHAASEERVRRSVVAMADTLTWIVIVPVLWLFPSMMRALVSGVRRKEET